MINIHSLQLNWKPSLTSLKLKMQHNNNYKQSKFDTKLVTWQRPNAYHILEEDDGSFSGSSAHDVAPSCGPTYLSAHRNTPGLSRKLNPILLCFTTWEGEATSFVGSVNEIYTDTKIDKNRGNKHPPTCPTLQNHTTRNGTAKPNKIQQLVQQPMHTSRRSSTIPRIASQTPNSSSHPHKFYNFFLSSSSCSSYLKCWPTIHCEGCLEFYSSLHLKGWSLNASCIPKWFTNNLCISPPGEWK